MTTQRDIYKQFLFELNQDLKSLEREDLDLKFENLITLENRFKKILLSYKKGIKVFDAFIKFIVEEEKDIRQAKIFFREREEVVANKLPHFFRTKDSESISKYNVNFKFIQWALKEDCPSRTELTRIFNEITKIRQDIIVQNMPLVINRSRIFQVKSKKYNIDYSDIMQTASEGFIDAIDKYVPDVPGGFKSVAIGRMSAHMTEQSMSGMVKLTTEEKKILYRANIAIYRLKMTDINKIFEFVKKSYPKVKLKDLENILAASNVAFSIDRNNDSDDKKTVGFFDRAKSDSHEDGVVTDDIKNKLWQNVMKLEIMEQKLVRLKTA